MKKLLLFVVFIFALVSQVIASSPTANNSAQSRSATASIHLHVADETELALVAVDVSSANDPSEADINDVVILQLTIDNNDSNGVDFLLESANAQDTPAGNGGAEMRHTVVYNSPDAGTWFNYTLKFDTTGIMVANGYSTGDNLDELLESGEPTVNLSFTDPAESIEGEQIDIAISTVQKEQLLEGVYDDIITITMTDKT